MARKTEVRYVNFYTVGSAAYQFDPQPLPKKKVTLPKPRRQKKILIHLDPVVALGFCATAVLVIMMIVGLVRLGTAQKQADEMSTYLAALQEENVKLEETYRAGFDPEEIRQIATAMGMIPLEQAQTVEIYVPAEEPVSEPGLFESFWLFLTGLFA